MASIHEHGGSFVSPYRLRELVNYPHIIQQATTDRGILSTEEARSTVPITDHSIAAPEIPIPPFSYEEYIPSHQFYEEPSNPMIDDELLGIIESSA